MSTAFTWASILASYHYRTSKPGSAIHEKEEVVTYLVRLDITVNTLPTTELLQRKYYPVR